MPNEDFRIHKQLLEINNLFQFFWNKKMKKFYRYSRYVNRVSIILTKFRFHFVSTTIFVYNKEYYIIQSLLHPSWKIWTFLLGYTRNSVRDNEIHFFFIICLVKQA